MMLVSVIVSTYNWKEALELSLRSMFIQTIKPAEIVVADDGSREDTKLLVDKLRMETDIPIIHVWHEDKGFRKTIILNKAIQKASYPYIIQIDGDIILDRHFIADHLELAEPGYFISGSRVGLTLPVTKHILRNKNYKPFFIQLGFKYMLNGIRSRVLRHYLAGRYAQKNLLRSRGCNMAFWKEDLYRVNGYNEDLMMWGQEDVELAHRLIYAGVNKKQLKMGGVEYHLYHKFASRANLRFHNEVLGRVINERRTWCDNGLVKLQVQAV